MRAILFDIDGTLTKSTGAGTRALARALESGGLGAALAELRRMRLDGMTDRGIVRLLLAAERGWVHLDPSHHHGPAMPQVDPRAREIPAAEIDRVLDGYLDALAVECANAAYGALPGVPALVETLAKRSGMLLGLCTGNLARGAELKLGCVGLWRHFGFGGYGSDAEHRPDVVRAALAKARARGATEAIVVDDTPRGIAAAHEAGLPALGVATGRWSTDELRAHGAELVIQSFADLEASLRLFDGAWRQA